MTEYDNNLRFSLWATKATAGRGEIDGTNYRSYLVATGASSEKAPSHKFIIESEDGQHVGIIPLWREENSEYGSIASGSGTFMGKAYYANVYPVQSENPKSPAINVKLKPKQAQQQPASAPEQKGTPPSDDIPF